MSRPIWFWQRIVTPHLAKLATSLAKQDRKVVYVSETIMSEDRRAQGWQAPELDGVELKLASEKNFLDLLDAAGPDAWHLCQGIRNNGLVSRVQRELRQRGLRSWVIMETVEDGGVTGIIKRLEYARHFWCKKKHIQGVLAIGHKTEGWLSGLGVPKDKVFPFAYFLGENFYNFRPEIDAQRPFRFIFIGQFIKRKRLDFLIKCLGKLESERFELLVVGSGPMEKQLKSLARTQIGPERLRWVGRIPQNEIPNLLSNTDCLVLPSSHDGWGAVVSEALLEGTHVICSDACGSASVVFNIQNTGVFPVNDAKHLVKLLKEAIVRGVTPIEKRTELASKSRSLGAEAGAKYLTEILDASEYKRCKPTPPWVNLDKTCRS